MGPSTDSDEILEGLIKSGMNVARCNFSHGSHEEHKGRMDRIKRLREKCDRPIAILLDTKGPEIRTGNFENDVVNVVTGQTFTLVADKNILGNNERVGITYPDLYKDVKEGTVILIDDGLVKMEVVKIDGTDIVCEVKNDGKIANHKGVNVPGVKINLPALTPKDISDIEFGITQGIDFIAASFVRKASDVLAIREVLENNTATDNTPDDHLLHLSPVRKACLSTALFQVLRFLTPDKRYLFFSHFPSALKYPSYRHCSSIYSLRRQAIPP